MKLILAAAALLALSATRDEVALRFAPDEDTVLVRTFDAEASYRLSSLIYAIEGEELDTGEELADVRMEFQEHVQVRDTLGASADGRPETLVRTFEELSQETSWSAGEETSATTSSSPFEGRRVRFTWDDEDERHTAEAADDEELEAELAALLDEDMDLRLVLPEDEVGVGDSWDVDVRLYLAFMWPGGLVEWQEGEEEASAEDRARNRQTIENLTGEGRARARDRDRAGVRAGAGRGNRHDHDQDRAHARGRAALGPRGRPCALGRARGRGRARDDPQRRGRERGGPDLHALRNRHANPAWTGPRPLRRSWEWTGEQRFNGGWSGVIGKG